ncbi:MAG: hypothetical protein QOJ80_7594 [Mycobacterium sp.]|nr:hypothetical protein [Mycobacterium sp.]
MPPQGGWQPPQPPGPPPNHGQPYGQPITPSGYNPEQPPPGWHQGPWQPQPGPPPQKCNSLKWLLIAVAVLLVIGISVGATLIFTRGDGGTTTIPTSGVASDIASANDTGPVGIITDEPTCDAYLPLSNSLSDIEAKAWGAERATLGPASEWTAQQRSQVTEVATAMRNAADQAVPLAKQTPHRLVRELYEQFIAFGRAYADSVQDYSPHDDGLASANVNAGSAIVGICNTITYGAASRSVGLEPAAPPTQTATIGDPGSPTRFVTESSSTCTEWTQRLDKYTADTPEWQNRDTSVPASNWTPEQRAIEQSTRPLLTAYAGDIERAGRESRNPVLEDFAVAASLYTKAYLSVGDNYNGAADGWLNYVAFRLANLVSGACRAVAA